MLRIGYDQRRPEPSPDPCFYACLGRLSANVDVDGLPYGELFGELVGGMFDLHWDQEQEAFFDFGQHVSDGELVTEVTVRCKKGAASVTGISF